MNSKEQTHRSWELFFTANAQAEAVAKIYELYPVPGSPERRDMLGWFQRWNTSLKLDPFRVLGAPPMQTNRLGKARFPADETLPVSGIADVDFAELRITIVKIHIRPPRRPLS